MYELKNCVDVDQSPIETSSKYIKSRAVSPEYASKKNMGAILSHFPDPPFPH